VSVKPPSIPELNTAHLLRHILIGRAYHIGARLSAIHLENVNGGKREVGENTAKN
jgi:hypothetical protein